MIILGNKKILITLLLWLGFFPVFFFAHVTYAQCTNPRSISESINCVKNEVAIAGGLSTADFTTVFTTVLNWILFTTALIALVVLIIGGISYMVSLGNEEKTRRAKMIVLYAIVGLFVIGLSFMIIETVKSFLVT